MSILNNYLNGETNARLEGSFFETLMRNALGDLGYSFAVGCWWTVTVGDELHIFYMTSSDFFSDSGVPTDKIAVEFIKLLLHNNLSVHLVKAIVDSDNVHYEVRKADRNTRLAVFGNLDDYLSRLYATVMATKKKWQVQTLKIPPQDVVYDPSRSVGIRHKIVLEAIKKDNLELEITLERIFVNNYINKYFKYIHDIDAIGRLDGELVALETKRKYRDKMGRFGINISLHKNIKIFSRFVDYRYIIVEASKFINNVSLESPIAFWYSEGVEHRFFELQFPVEETLKRYNVDSKKFSIGSSKDTDMIPSELFKLILER